MAKRATFPRLFLSIGLTLAAAARGQPAPEAPVFDEKRQLRGVQGTVEQVDYRGGVLVVSTGDEPLRLRARGGDLAGFAPGQHVTLRYEMIGQVPWLEPPVPAEGAPSYPPAGRVGYAFGLVRSVDRSRGEIVVVGPTPELREVTAVAHPRQLLGVLPGQMVAARYVYLGVGLPSVIELSLAPLSSQDNLTLSSHAAGASAPPQEGAKAQPSRPSRR